VFGANGAATGVGVLVYVVIAVIEIAALWTVFTKSGNKGWPAIIPILNTLVLLKIVKRPLWWIILLLIPCVNIVVFIIVLIDLAKAFGKGTGFTVGLVLLEPIFILILGFGSSQYQLDPDPLF
jgi:hypothetical protein